MKVRRAKIRRKQAGVSGRGGGRAAKRAAISQTQKRPRNRQRTAAAGGHGRGRAGADVAPQDLFPSLFSPRSVPGRAVLLAFGRTDGTAPQFCQAKLERIAGTGEQRPRRPRRPCVSDPIALARTLNGLAHPDRIRIVEAIHAGARTHQDLKMALHLQTGPLYHHLRELERAGLVSCAGRNSYRLSAAGTQTLLFSSGLQALLSDKRSHAPWKVKRSRLPRPRGA